MIPPLHFAFVTLFPEPIDVWLRTSILGRAHTRGLFTFEIYSLRDFADDRHRRVDDVPYGGGGGMVLKVEPLARAAEALKAKFSELKPLSVFFSPRGIRLDQKMIRDLAAPPAQNRCFILFCGHYEGVDQRFIDHWVDLELSLGDFVLTGGEIPAIAFTEARVRYVEGVLDSEERYSQESFSLSTSSGAPLLEYPHYTRPADFEGYRVPQILLSGDHQKIAKWRIEAAQAHTLAVRPDLIG